MSEHKRISVQLWGTDIGTVIWNKGIGYFEYSEQVKKMGIELSPITMPLSNEVYSFGALSKQTFKGLPGLIADSLPDKFGNRLIDQYLARKGLPGDTFTPLDRLCYIGTRAMGGLEFYPLYDKKKEQSSTIDIDEMVELANEALSEKNSLATSLDITSSDQNKKDAVENIISIGTSAGGARAKAVIAYNEQTHEVKTGQTYAGKDFSYWLLKFDGVTENKDKETLSDPVGFGLLEYVYYEMARSVDIDMTRCRLLQEGDRSHFMTERFDRINGGHKVHMQTLCGLAHYDFNDSGAYSYEQLFMVMRQLNLPFNDFLQMYKRAIFNVVARNQDDHTKNFSFLMDQTGKWSLSPAYDITYCNGSHWTARHQMTINGKTDDFALTDLFALASSADIKVAKAKSIIEEVIQGVSLFDQLAKDYGLIEFAKSNHNIKALVDDIPKHLRLYF